jgi:3-oxoacyl-[acyl-carrier-protein] synthase-1
MKARSVFVRGKAIACALGEDPTVVVAAMRANAIKTTPIAFELTEPDRTRPYYILPGKDAICAGDPAEWFYEVLISTVARAIADAGLSPAQVEAMGIFLGSTSMDIPIYETLYCAEDRQTRDYFTQSASGFGAIAARVAEHFGIAGPCHTFTTACTSSANGLLYASALIEQGELSRALVIGYDRFNQLGFYGFEALKLLSGSTYRPFDKRRDGIIMGEACGAVILDSERMRADDFQLLGGANTCDTHNVALHNTDGKVVAQVMAAALAAAGIPAARISAIKAHATGSVHNDLTEANAIRSVFGSQVPPVTGLKPYLGHTVGACGVVELLLFAEAVRAGFIPATPGWEVFDEELALTPLLVHLPIDRGTFLLNYFGFGGNCTTLIVTNEE